MFLNIQIDLIILKTYDQQFTLTTKRSLHIICKKAIQFFVFFSKWKRVIFHPVVLHWMTVKTRHVQNNMTLKFAKNYAN